MSAPKDEPSTPLALLKADSATLTFRLLFGAYNKN
jgi:hypothetical protein